MPFLWREKKLPLDIRKRKILALCAVSAALHSSRKSALGAKNRFLLEKVSPAAQHLQHFKAPASCNNQMQLECTPPAFIHSTRKKVVNAPSAVAKMSFVTHAEGRKTYWLRGSCARWVSARERVAAFAFARRLLEECHRCRLLTLPLYQKTHAFVSEWACTYMKLRRSSFRCANEQRKRVANGRRAGGRRAKPLACICGWRKLTSEF